MTPHRGADGPPAIQTRETWADPFSSVGSIRQGPPPIGISIAVTVVEAEPRLPALNEKAPGSCAPGSCGPCCKRRWVVGTPCVNRADRRKLNRRPRLTKAQRSNSNRCRTRRVHRPLAMPRTTECVGKRSSNCPDTGGSVCRGSIGHATLKESEVNQQSALETDWGPSLCWPPLDDGPWKRIPPERFWRSGSRNGSPNSPSPLPSPWLPS